MNYLQQVWEITQQWEALWDEWKGGHLASLQTEAMDNTSQTMFKRLHTLSREFKASQRNTPYTSGVNSTLVSSMAKLTLMGVSNKQC